MTKIERIQFATVVRPMKTTFATSLGAKTCATSVIIKITCSDGCIGIGEVPTSFVFKHETIAAIKNMIADARRYVIGRRIWEYESLIKKCRSDWPQFHMSISGLEVALFRAWLATGRKNEFRFWGSKTKTLETDITIPFVTQVNILNKWLSDAIKTGFRIFKIKVSGDIKTDLKFVCAIYENLNANLRDSTIRLDGNQGFTASSCLKLLDKLEKKKIAIELFEQPVLRDDYAGFKKLYSRSPVPIIADETVLNSADCRRVIEERLAHGINIKIVKSGIADSMQILQMAQKAKLKVMIGCMTESMYGLSAAINFAAGTNAFDYIDLDSIHFLYHKKNYDGITIAGRNYILR